MANVHQENTIIVVYILYMGYLLALEPYAIITALGYVGLTLVIFAESGLFYGFFLPGDSLLFTAGLLAAHDVLYFPLLLGLIPVAAILGDSVGYAFGLWVGPRIFVKEDSLLFSKHHVKRAEAILEKYEQRAIILA